MNPFATFLVAISARQTGAEGRFGNEPTAACENSMSLVGQLQHKKWRIQLAAKEKTIRWLNAANEVTVFDSDGLGSIKIDGHTLGTLILENATQSLQAHAVLPLANKPLHVATMPLASGGHHA